MTLDTMRKRIKKIGERTSEEGDRGFMSRGLKDCTELGNITIESIVDDKFYACKLTTVPEFIPLNDRERVDQERRKKLSIEKRNGTVVTLELKSTQKIPRVDTIKRDLAWHYALRDILAENSDTHVFIKKRGKRVEKITYYQPEGNIVVPKKDFTVTGYPQAKCSLVIWKSDDFLDDSKGDRFRKSGIIIKAKRAIHECSLLQPGLEREISAKKYFGRLDCPYIDDLLKEYDERREKGLELPPENPCLLIDPNRKSGLIREHPFTQALLEIPTQILKELIEQEQKKNVIKKEEIANDNTRDRLSDLAKLADKFLSKQIEDIDDPALGDPFEDGTSDRGVFVYPNFFNVNIDEVRVITFYIRQSLINTQDETVHIISEDNDKLAILDELLTLRKHSKKEDILLCTFRVCGKKISNDRIKIKVEYNNLPSVEAFGKVVEDRGREHDFISQLEFEHKQYSIREGSKKTLKIFAKYPQLVGREERIEITSADSISLPIRGSCKITPVSGTNFALGEVVIEGRRLKKNSILVTAKYNGIEATTRVKIVQKEESKVNIEIKLVDEDFGNFRAMWAIDEGKPNLLKISSRHNSISRYLGQPPDFLGQDSPHFKLLLAEIVAESVCRKALSLESKAHPWEFRLSDLREDYLIVDDVMARLQKRIRDFAEGAHKIMLKDSEIPK